jgi:hypothetical protein
LIPGIIEVIDHAFADCMPEYLFVDIPDNIPNGQVFVFRYDQPLLPVLSVLELKVYQAFHGAFQQAPVRIGIGISKKLRNGLYLFVKGKSRAQQLAERLQ